MTYPLSLNPSGLGPFDQPDALENAWTLSWISHQVVTHPLDLFGASTFHPLPHSLAFSEHLFVPGLIALPVLALTNDLVFTYNLLILLATISSALGMYLLTVFLTRNRIAAILAGLFYSFIPYRFDRLHLLQLQFHLFLPLVLVCLHRFLKTGERRWAWAFGGFFVLQVLSGSHLAVMAAAVILSALLTLSPGASCSGRDLAYLVMVLALAVAIVCPFSLPYLEHHRVEWSLDAIEYASANPATFVASSSRLYRPLNSAWFDGAPRDFLFPGVTLLLFGAGGVAILLSSRGDFPRPWAHASFYVLILIAGVVLSFGPKTPIYVFLYKHIAFFRGLRNVTQYACLLFLSLSVFSSFALAWLLDSDRTARRRKWIVASITAFFLIESTTAPLALVPFRDEPPEVYSWLAKQTDAGAILELPFQVRQPRYLFWARHYEFRPSLGGTSRYVPASHQWMEVVLRHFPSKDSLALLSKLDVRYVIVHLDSYAPHDLLHLLNGLAQFRYGLLPLLDFGTELVFELTWDEPPYRPSSGTPSVLNRLAPPTFVVDSSPRARGSETQVESHLHSRARVMGLRLHYGPNPRIPVEWVELTVLNDEGAGERTWATPPDWPALTELIMGLLDNPKDGTQLLRFEPLEMERFRIRLRGSEGPLEISEIEILGSPSPN
jgi:hypothetical protein